MICCFAVCKVEAVETHPDAICISYPKRRYRSRYEVSLSLKLLLGFATSTGQTIDRLQGGEKTFWEQVLILYRRQDQMHAKLGWLEWSLPL